MKELFKEHKWFLFMIIGIGLMTSTVVSGELFHGQTIMASVLIIISLMLESAKKDI